MNKEILQYLHFHPNSSRKDIIDGLAFTGSDATMKRYLAAEVRNGTIGVSGQNKATRYSLSSQAHLLMPINLDTYFAHDIDERQVQTSFNFDLITRLLPEVNLFTLAELEHLQSLQDTFRRHVTEMTMVSIVKRWNDWA